MDQGKQIRLSSAEVSQLRIQYMNDSGSICMLTYFLEKAEDAEIKPIIALALKLAQSHIQKIADILSEEKTKVPHGFKVEEDVDLNAPRLFSDSYVLRFIHSMAQIGLNGYSVSLSLSVRADIINHFTESLNETMELYRMSTELLLSKGLYVRSPYFPNLEKIEYVSKQGFLWDVFGQKRPLQVLEVTNLYSNVQRNALGVATLTGFAQVAKEKDVRQFFQRGIEIAKKHVKIFGGKLEESNLPVPMTWASEISTSTTYTFSDKLMMFFASALIALSVGYYGTGIAQSPRVDLGVMYNRLSLEIQLFAEDGANLMIKNKWLEQPPMAPDRLDLQEEK
ncbi:MAG: DUF3231 family protein [Bacillota bacterium]|nr:DUF3231 family protein [Bacillota bacterium]